MLEETVKLLMQGVTDCLVPNELIAKLKENRPLRIKLGLDPTAPDIHLGHSVVMNKLREFQELGHEVTFLIGDFTAMIGDPTGKNVMRQPLSKEEIMQNANTYQNQAFKILDPDKTKVEFNSTWLAPLSSTAFIKVASTCTVARMLERDDFKKRYSANQPIGIHEFFYPLVQGYDSVEMQADVELGGTDQRFNLLVGRELQKHFKQKPQIVMTMPLLEGLDGVRKMSKSYDNYVGITDSPDDMFGKLMSISDVLMWRYLEVLNLYPAYKITALKTACDQGMNPRDVKVELAKKIVTQYHSPALAEKAHQSFVNRFQKNALPDDLKTQILTAEKSALGIAYVLKRTHLVKSTSEALRMIKQSAVKVDGTRIKNTQYQVKKNGIYIVQVGKRRATKVQIN
jgi:tyrosyl-tRNA synthetase